MNKILLQQMVADKLVTVQKHPTEELYIYNYAVKVQFERLWNEITLQARGLILDGDMNVVAKPFGKFFNFGESSMFDIPALPFEVFEKMDGSLGILYWIGEVPYIATRGSFTSDQAVHATQVLHSKYSSIFDKLDRKSTYLFEIIYPENCIVLSYGNMDDLVLLTVIDNETGEERIEDVGFPIVKRYDGIDSIGELKALEEPNKEGFVIRFSNGFRVKVKFDEYMRLHRIVSGVSNVTIWEYMSEGRDFDELLDKVPDEFYEWVQNTRYDLHRKYTDVLEECKNSYKSFDTEKEAAFYYKTQKYPHILFNIMRNKPISNLVWKTIKPAWQKGIKVTNES